MKKGKLKKNKNNKKKKVFIVVLILILIILIGGFCTYKYYENEKAKKRRAEEIERERKRVEIKEEVILETGSEAPILTDFIVKKGNLDNDAVLEFLNISEEEKDKTLKTKEVYLDQEAKETTANKKVTSKFILIGIGNYDVTIKDAKNNKNYKSKLIVQDTIKPNLTVKNVTIEEGTKVDVKNFLDKCSDNSNEECEIYYVQKNGNEYEKIDKISTAVGERNILIQAKDKSGNLSDVKTAKLKVNAKKKEVKSKSQNKSKVISSSKTKASTSGSNSKKTSSGCGSKGYSLYMPASKYKISKSKLYYFISNCDGKYSAWDKTGPINDAYFDVQDKFGINYWGYHEYPSGKMVSECNEKFGDNDCYNIMKIEFAYDNATYNVVGIYAEITMYHNSTLLGKGYYTKSGMHWDWKKF